MSKQDLGDMLEQQAARIAGLEAKLDALLLEYCPGEMSAEQIAEWERNQVASRVPDSPSESTWTPEPKDLNE